MDAEEFRKHLKRRGKKDHVIDSLIGQVEQFRQFVGDTLGADLDTATCDDLEAYADRAEGERKGKGRIVVRGVGLYYTWLGKEELASCAGAIREAGIARTRQSPALVEFLGVNPSDVERLASAGIGNTEQMIEAGRTPAQRRALSWQTGLPMETILEFVKLSDLARIPGIAGIRARLYHDAGADTLDNLATWEPEPLRQMLVEFVERTGFEGIAPLPKETKSAVDKARKLPKLVEW
jgi:hypothetical protein